MKGVIGFILVSVSIVQGQLLEFGLVGAGGPAEFSGTYDAGTDYDGNTVVDVWITDSKNDKIYLG